MVLERITVDPQGWIVAGERRLRCALGKAGITNAKVEGDLATPAGLLHMERVYYRADRMVGPPITSLPVDEIEPDMGWCDDPDHGDYNQLVTLPHPARHEKLWREDSLYDVVVVLDHNTHPVESGRGSAIFMHIAKPDFSGTEGCIALDKKDLLQLLLNCNESTEIEVSAP
ncbi:L,D-transpeptidase family protein [Magnetovibrio sp. PR-2]|uniref:L,D-transpeptidase family protein n=1 Tax=Magnetovibrio sp. PR-2 TaxID=3120356 RepID=UPI002FCE2E17